MLSNHSEIETREFVAKTVRDDPRNKHPQGFYWL